MMYTHEKKILRTKKHENILTSIIHLTLGKAHEEHKHKHNYVAWTRTRTGSHNVLQNSWHDMAKFGHTHTHVVLLLTIKDEKYKVYISNLKIQIYWIH